MGLSARVFQVTLQDLRKSNPNHTRITEILFWYDNYTSKYEREYPL